MGRYIPGLKQLNSKCQVFEAVNVIEKKTLEFTVNILTPFLPNTLCLSVRTKVTFSYIEMLKYE